MSCGPGDKADISSRYFSANYAVVVALLAVYSLLTNITLLFALGFLIGGFLAIGRFGEYCKRCIPHRPAAHPYGSGTD